MRRARSPTSLLALHLSVSMTGSRAEHPVTRKATVTVSFNEMATAITGVATFDLSAGSDVQSTRSLYLSATSSSDVRHMNNAWRKAGSDSGVLMTICLHA